MIFGYNHFTANCLKIPDTYYQKTMTVAISYKLLALLSMKLKCSINILLSVIFAGHHKPH